MNRELTLIFIEFSPLSEPLRITFEQSFKILSLESTIIMPVTSGLNQAIDKKWQLIDVF